MSAPYEVRGKFPDNHGTYPCETIYDIYDAMFTIQDNGGEVTWIGQRVNLGMTPNKQFMMYEYKEMEVAF